MFLSRCLAPLATRRENLWAEYQSEKSLEVTASEKTFSSCAMCKPVRKNQCSERLKLIEPPPWTLSLNSLKYAINRQIRQLSAFIEIVSGVRIFLHLKAKKKRFDSRVWHKENAWTYRQILLFASGYKHCFRVWARANIGQKWQINNRRNVDFWDRRKLELFCLYCLESPLFPNSNLDSKWINQPCW